MSRELSHRLSAGIADVLQVGKDAEMKSQTKKGCVVVTGTERL